MKYFFVLFGTLLVLLFLYFRFSTGRIATTHVINMESSRDRFAQFMAGAKRADLNVTRWNAVNGKALRAEDMPKYNIDLPLYEARKKEKRLGVIGCYLSHKTLLQNLETTSCGLNDFHLIFEDDVVLPTNIKSRIYGIVNQLPSDWDYLQLFTHWPQTLPWKGEIHKPNPNVKGNWSTAAYAVRHGALPKINAHIRKMHTPIDDQLLEKCGVWKWFTIQPDLVTVNDGGKTMLNDTH